MTTDSILSRVYNHDCSGCKLAAFCNHICMSGERLGEGDSAFDILIINESPNYEDDDNKTITKSTPFKLLDRLLDQTGLDKSKIYYTNLVKCTPYDPMSGSPTAPGKDEVEACVKYLWEEIEIIKPKLIITLGKTAASILTDQDKLGKIRGEVIETNLSFPSGDQTIPVIPTWSPSYILRGNSTAEVDLLSDLLYAKTFLYGDNRKTKYTLINDPDTLIKFTQSLLKAYKAGKLENNWIAVDIETNDNLSGDGPSPYSKDTNIVSIQITWKSGMGVLIPVIRPQSKYDKEPFESVFDDPINIKILIKCLREILETIPVVGQNYTFDYKYIYTKLGIKTKTLAFDTMLAHHMLKGGSESNALDFMTVKYLKIPNHKKDLKDFMNSLPKEDKNFSNVPLDILLKYGCGDTDSTYQLAAVLRDELMNFKYDSFNQPVEYENMYEAFMDLYMKPFEMIVSMELAGAKLDVEKWPELEAKLLKEMEEQISIVKSSKYFSKWQELNKIENPKRRKKIRNTKNIWFVCCESCGAERKYDEGSSPNCLDCGEKGEEKKAPRHLKVKFRKRANPDYATDSEPKFLIDYNEPEFIDVEFNMNSTKHLVSLFYDCMGFSTKKHGGNTDKLAVSSMLREATNSKSKRDRIDIIQAISKYRKSAKLHSAYFKSLPRFLYVTEESESNYLTKDFEPDTGVNFIHTNYLQHGTTSGRLSTRDPSLHTMPFKSVVKQMFISRHEESGLILQADYSQLEVRIFAVKTQDKGLIKVYNENGDIHRYAASQSFSKDEKDVTEKERKISKAVTFRIIYGGGPEGMNEQSPELDLTLEQAKKIFSNFLSMMPNADKWINSQKNFVRDHCIALSRLGRIRPLHKEVKEGKAELAHAERVGVNFPIQSLGNDIGLQSLSRVHEDLKSKKSVLFGSVHDSAIIDLHAAEIFDLMECIQTQMSVNALKQYPWFNVPLKVDMEVGTSWGDLVSIKSYTPDGQLTLEGNKYDVKSVVKVLKNSYNVEIKSMTEDSDIINVELFLS